MNFKVACPADVEQVFLELLTEVESLQEERLSQESAEKLQFLSKKTCLALDGYLQHYDTQYAVETDIEKSVQLHGQVAMIEELYEYARLIEQSAKEYLK